MPGKAKIIGPPISAWGKPQRIRDPLHNLIEFDTGKEFEAVMWQVLRTRPFQRLRRIKQLGFSELIYPGATHTRFAHSLGVFHTARRLMTIIERYLEKRMFRRNKAEVALAAALVHNLGHGPFSHAFEEVGKQLKLKMARHEEVGKLMIQNGEVAEVLNQLGGGFANDVAELIGSKGPRDLYDAVVSSQFDADRLDYMRRDRMMTGVQGGAIDLEWLMGNLEIGSVPASADDERYAEVETFVLGPKASFAAETYVLGLFQLYPTVYFHKTTRGAEKLFSSLLHRVFTTIMAGGENVQGRTGLPLGHPLVRFARQPESLELALGLDDTVVWGALSMLSEAQDSTISEFAVRLRDRLLFRCVDVRERVARHVAPKLATSVESRAEAERDIDVRATLIKEKLAAWSSERAGERPRILIDEAVRSPYNRFQESKGAQNQIRIRTTDGRIVDMAEGSTVIAGIDTFRLFRVYVDRDDREAGRIVEQAIEEQLGGKV